MTAFLWTCVVYFGLQLFRDAGSFLSKNGAGDVADWLSLFTHAIFLFWLGVLIGAN